MKRFAVIALVLAAGCTEPPRQNRAAIYFEGLEDMWRWHPTRGGAGEPSYDGMLSLDPNDSVPTLVRGLTDTNSTKIEPGVHASPVVGDICFQLLLEIFGMKVEQFADDGVRVTKVETNPIHAVRLDDPGVRRRLQERFGKLALERGWTGEPK